MEYIGPAYKYRSFGLFDDKVKSRINESLVECKCYFSAPESLNDPLEYNPYVITNKKLYQEYFENMGKQKGYKLTNEQISILANRESVTFDNTEFKKIISKYAGVFCMSKSPVLNTQWAYYGGDHTGYCIEYSIDENFSAVCGEVGYTCNRPVVEFPRFYVDDDYRKGKLQEVNFSKSDEWRLEKEVRAIVAAPGSVQIRKKSITGVIFGYRCKGEHKKYVVDLILSHAPHVKIYECKLNGISYTFEKVPAQD